MKNVSSNGWANANKRIDNDLKRERPERTNNTERNIQNKGNKEDKALDKLSKLIDINTNNKSVMSNTKQDPNSIWGADTFEKWRVSNLERRNSIKSVAPVDYSNIIRTCNCGCGNSLTKRK